MPRVFGVIWTIDLAVPPLAHGYRQPNGDIAYFYCISWVTDAKNRVFQSVLLPPGGVAERALQACEALGGSLV